jgi:hypothetical protein
MTTDPNRVDFEIPQSNIVPWLEQELTLQDAADLTNATVQLVYWKPGNPQVFRTAEIVSYSPSLNAAETVVVRYRWTAADTAVVTVYNFQWKFTLGDGTPMHQPPKSPTVFDRKRVWQTFEVTPTA